MTVACVIEIKRFNLQIQQMDLKPLPQTNVDNLHITINGYLRHRDDRISIYLAYTAEKICGCDSHIRLIHLIINMKSSLSFATQIRPSLGLNTGLNHTKVCSKLSLKCLSSIGCLSSVRAVSAGFGSYL